MPDDFFGGLGLLTKSFDSGLKRLVHANQIGQWRKQLLEQLPAVFSERRQAGEQAREEKEAELYRQIGQLKVEVEWLKKKSQQLR